MGKANYIHVGFQLVVKQCFCHILHTRLRLEHRFVCSRG